MFFCSVTGSVLELSYRTIPWTLPRHSSLACMEIPIDRAGSGTDNKYEKLKKICYNQRGGLSFL